MTAPTNKEDAALFAVIDAVKLEAMKRCGESMMDMPEAVYVQAYRVMQEIIENAKDVRAAL